MSEDTLKKIELADSLYFSFYFQPGGGGIVSSGAGDRIGNQPDENDSLVLEFGYIKMGDTIWNHIWSTGGFSLKEWTDENPHEFFKQILIPITDNHYLCDSFRFRFRNYASLEPQQGISGWEGNVDQWHIDYIRLDINRNINDKYTNDLTIVSPTTSFLKNYQEMPWKQFHNDDMKSNFTNQLANLSDASRTSLYKYYITRNGNTLHEYNKELGVVDIAPYSTNGIQTHPKQAAPEILFTPGILTDTATFTITHIFQNPGGNDFDPVNDTCVYKQKFRNYYAYDDGTAEYGYCINNVYNRAYLAMKFSLRQEDQLSAVQMWFNRTKNSENEEALFNIMIWNDNDGEPGEKPIYTVEGKRPKFEGEFLDYATYKFDEKITVNGTIWVGFEQQGNVQLNIGFDQNTDSREFFKYKTQNIWEVSSYKGTPMIRPCFGDTFYSVSENAPISNIKVFPNPTTGVLNLIQEKVESGELRVESVEVFDIYGKKMSPVSNLTSHISNQINIAHLPAGIYFVKITTEAGEVVKKIIKN
jgi:hypothetical protein